NFNMAVTDSQRTHLHIERGRDAHGGPRRVLLTTSATRTAPGCYACNAGHHAHMVPDLRYRLWATHDNFVCHCGNRAPCDKALGAFYGFSIRLLIRFLGRSESGLFCELRAA